jgi:N-acyl-D-aspartate/D-glutamate deacylase
VRRYGRLWQATPPTDSPLKVLQTFLLTSGRLFGKPLKITAVAALDVRSNRNIIRSAYALTRLLNSRLLKGRFTLQTLAARFKVWADGPVTPLSEEIPELRELMIPDLEDDAGRRRLYEDPAFEARFKAMWRKGKTGRSLDRVKRLLRLEDYALRRAPEEMFVDKGPVAEWSGESLASLVARVKKFQASREGARSAAERAAFEKFPRVEDDADLMFHLLREYDRGFVWWTVSANADERRLRRLVMDPIFQPGFADSGAHLSNMAFYDVNLRALRIAHEERGEDGVAYMTRRLTRDAAALFDVNAGSIDPGAEADIVLIDPRALLSYDGEAGVRRVHRDVLGCEQLVNRSDGVVAAVFLKGERVFDGAAFADSFERRKFGRVLTARGADRTAA